MKLDRIFNYIGFGLLGLCICLSLFRVLTRKVQESDPNLVTIRFAHWQLESGVRDAFQKVADRYEEMHPGVKIEQMLVPERIYPNWATTQLVGGTAPDLVELGKGAEAGDRVARFFIPSTEVADQPNPYNKGTHLEGVPWRETFIDGMEGAYREDLADYYGIPTFLISIRMYYNRDLMKEITGKDEPPKTYDELIALCQQVQEFANRPENRDRKLLPIAGSKYNAPPLTDRLFESQTQTFEPVRSTLPVMQTNAEEMALNYLRGKWNLYSPEIQLGMEITRDISQYLQPGYLQLGREDATLYFVQERALMIATGSWDASSIFMLANESGFEVGVFQPPLPDKDHPKYGKNVLGIASEANTKSFGAFALFRGSKHPERAIDFMMYLTSVEGNRLWSQTSKWPPIVDGVEPSEETKPFMPISEGEINGMNLRPLGGGAVSGRIVENSLYKLVEPNGSVEEFVKLVEPSYAEAFRTDIREKIKNRLRSIQRQDGNIVSATYFQSVDPENPRGKIKHDSLWENQLVQEMQNAYFANELKSLEAGHGIEPGPGTAAIE